MFRAGLIILVVSVTANLFLWFARTDSRHTSSEVQREKHERILRLPKPTVIAESPQQESSQNESRSALEQRLLRLNKRIDELRPAKERFRDGARSPDAENVARSYLDRVFDARLDSPRPFSVECHALTCRLQTQRPIQEWQHALQSSYPERALFCQMLFSDEVYLDFCDPELWGANLMEGVRLALLGSDATSSCAANATGDLTFTVWFDEGERRLHSSLAGPLAANSVGSCLESVLNGILARTQIPSAIRSMPRTSFRVLLPLQRD